MNDEQEGPAHFCWRAVTELQAGMVLARPARAAHGSRATLLIGAGATLTESTITQLIARGVECVAVLEACPGDAEWATAEAAYQQRLQQIFGGEPEDRGCIELLAALRQLGPCLC
ncbi:hypothetical protein VX159_09975 [Dechloromonas sp. ZY10]|uniref:hypothetical protein n=1 Tax=Dechloromonas aquae TaxID=2664436 RepID=UPI003528D186